MKNTLPVVRGRLTFFDVLVVFLSPLDETTPGLVSVISLGIVDTCFAATLVSLEYGVALTRFAIFSPNQKAATCLAAKLVSASGLDLGLPWPRSACAGEATRAVASRPTATPPNARVRFKVLSMVCREARLSPHASVKDAQKLPD